MSKQKFPERSLRMPARPDQLASRLEPLSNTIGWKAYCRGELTSAIAGLKASLSNWDEDGAAWELLGLALRDAGRPLQAADALERAALVHRLLPLSRLVLAECYAVLKRHELARDLYMLQADEADDDVDLLLLIGSGLDGIDQPKLAMNVCRRAAYIDPECAQAAYDMCFYSMRCGCPASVAESLAWRAVELEPDNIHFRIGLASLLIRLDNKSRAMWVLRNVMGEQFQQITCPCCLDRLAELFCFAGEAVKMQQCLARLEQLEKSENESSDQSIRGS